MSRARRLGWNQYECTSVVAHLVDELRLAPLQAPHIQLPQRRQLDGASGHPLVAVCGDGGAVSRRAQLQHLAVVGTVKERCGAQKSGGRKRSGRSLCKHNMEPASRKSLAWYKKPTCAQGTRGGM